MDVREKGGRGGGVGYNKGNEERGRERSCISLLERKGGQGDWGTFLRTAKNKEEKKVIKRQCERLRGHPGTSNRKRPQGKVKIEQDTQDHRFRDWEEGRNEKKTYMCVKARSSLSLNTSHKCKEYRPKSWGEEKFPGKGSHWSTATRIPV